jgi:hypothetical protein
MSIIGNDEAETPGLELPPDDSARSRLATKYSIMQN